MNLPMIGGEHKWTEGERRTWAALAGSLKIIDRLLKPALLGVACSALGERGQSRMDVIGGPVMSGPGRRVRIIVEKDEAAAAGTSLQPKGGDKSPPSQIKRRGIAEPSAKAGEFNHALPPESPCRIANRRVYDNGCLLSTCGKLTRGPATSWTRHELH
jgi:hypothetical protein